MKKITCEICGNNDLIKKDDVFVCEYCGTKYSLEEAKKMMIEGTVKIDNSDKFYNYCVLARRARDEEDCENAAKYYDLMLQEDPNDWEASFYSYFFNIAVNQRKVNGDYPSFDIRKLTLQINRIVIRISTFESVDEQAAHIYALSNCINNINRIFHLSWDYGGENRKYYLSPILTVAVEYADKLEEKFNDKYIRYAFDSWKRIVNFASNRIYIMDESYREQIRNKYTAKIQKYQPQYVPPKVSGCYIATSVYGSYDCPQVWTLRRYRDTTLASTIFGRTFIRSYYAISPTLVKLFGKTKWFSGFWKGVLDLFVRKLNESGVEDTRYQDRQW